MTSSAKVAGRTAGKLLVLVGHVLVVSLAVVVPLAVVVLGHDPLRIVAISFGVALLSLALILGGDWIADSSRTQPRGLSLPSQRRRHSVRNVGRQRTGRRLSTLGNGGRAAR